MKMDICLCKQLHQTKILKYSLFFEVKSSYPLSFLSKTLLFSFLLLILQFKSIGFLFAWINLFRQFVFLQILHNEYFEK
jgi:hypothetical protein